MKGSGVCCVAMAALLLGGVGCGHYTITFQVEDVINDGGKGDSAAEQLNVDVVCLTKKDAADFPELADGTWWSRDWFAARDQNDQRLRKLDKRIFALRNGQPGPHDTLKGPPLVSGRRTDRHEFSISFQHPQSLASESAIVIYGRFHDGKGGILNTQPVLIHPLPAWDKEIVIGVGRTGLERLADR
ncbi:MAG: hypothetical protein PVJ57_01180 [Phycisphaerae bacterium]